MAKGFFSRFGKAEPSGAPQTPSPEAPRPAPIPAPAVEEIVRVIVCQKLPEAPRKAAISLRLDADVLDWFRGQGAGYQTRINAVLRAFMDASN